MARDFFRGISWIAAWAILVLQGCHISEKHIVDHSWREQHLLSLAIDEAVEKFPVEKLSSGVIAVSVRSHVENVAPYLEEALRSALKRRGIRVSEEHGTATPSQLVSILVDTAAAESMVRSLEIPLPIPFIATSLGVPIRRKFGVWAWVRFSGTINDAFTSEILATIPVLEGGLHFYETHYFGLIGPFHRSNLPEDDPVFVLDWD